MQQRDRLPAAAFHRHARREHFTATWQGFQSKMGCAVRQFQLPKMPIGKIGPCDPGDDGEDPAQAGIQQGSYHRPTI
jgi:hypothetical protein